MSIVPRAGWAVRREACLSTEIGKSTWGIWWSCCPHGMTRYVDAANNSRCDFSNTTEEILTQCANSSLIQWTDIKGSFCCEPGLYGFSDSAYSKGCVTQDTLQKGIADGTMQPDENDGVSPVTSTNAANPTSSQSLVSSSSSTTANPTINAENSTSPQSSKSSSDTGAIVGGAIGGVVGVILLVGIIWFWIRRKHRSPTPELDSKATRAELSNGASPGHMLPVIKDSPSELL